MVRKVVILGAGGRDFHNFNVAFRDDPGYQVVAFTAAQIPGIDDRRYPASLAGRRYPDGIPIRPESELEELVSGGSVDEVVHAYSDVSHEDVMHLASRVLAAGADFVVLGPARTMLRASRPVVAVCAVRTGAGKSPTTRRVGRILVDAGLRVALVRHPMPYGDLRRLGVQRFETLADIDAADPTVEEREEYEPAVQAGLLMFAGVDYAAVLRAAEAEADVIVWDGGNNDLPFFAPDLHITVLDALRPGHEVRYHPGEANARMADVVVVNKVDTAAPAAVAEVTANIARLNPGAAVVMAASPVLLEPGPSLAGRRVVVVEDGPTITHGGMPFGAGSAAVTDAGGVLVDPRPYAVGSIRDTFDRFPDIGPVLPAMGYGAAQLAELEATLQAAECDLVVTGTPIDLARIIDAGHPIRRVTYELVERGSPTLPEVLAPLLAKAVAVSAGAAPPAADG